MISRIDKVDNIYIKRNDLLEYLDCYGGKAEGSYNLIQKGISLGYTKFCTIGSRFSPQCEIVSTMCEKLGYECHLFMPGGKDT